MYGQLGLEVTFKNRENTQIASNFHEILNKEFYCGN
jgi:hypothetical protein